jgi:hypothetical protein
MSIPAAWPRVLDFFGRALVLEPSDGQLSSDAGLLAIGPFDDRVGLTRAFTDALDDPRDPDLTEHTFLEMVRSRVYGILAGYEDQNDHATLRADPVVAEPGAPVAGNLESCGRIVCPHHQDIVPARSGHHPGPLGELLPAHVAEIEAGVARAGEQLLGPGRAGRPRPGGPRAGRGHSARKS